MATKYYALLTNVGAAKLANATALGEQVEITQMAVGDGNGALPTPSPAQTALVHELRRAPLNTLTIDPVNTNQIIAEQVIQGDVGGWWIREIGLYDSKGDLIAIANCAETYKPLLQEGSGRVQVIRVILIVSSTQAVTLKIDPSVVLATRQYVDNAVIEVKGYVDQQLTAHIAAANPHKQYAPIASPALTGKPTTPTAADKDNSTQIANTAFVQAALAALVGSSPETLDTLNELAAALGNDPNFATTVTNSLAGKMDKAANGSDIENVSVFLQNLGLGTAANKNVGNSVGQVPDMSFFPSNAAGRGVWFKFPNGMILQVLECSCPSTDTAGYQFQLPTTFPTNFSGAILTPKDPIGDIVTSPTYMPDSLSAIRVYNFSGGGNNITALCIGF
ncbi:phage tail protein [Enterobacter roggenkampii]|uniref:Variable tail fiber protein n=1 Tax=Enterobacter roggenkampii TaxID=1812935 RepID=A0ABD7KJ91_9ENTR|nr:phage tail protein [Enterobacter roggenkampii]SAC57183.1 variable tail fiber protein [Enterobacter roggenkampii]